MKGVQNVCKNGILKGKGLELGAEPPRIKLFEYPPGKKRGRKCSSLSLKIWYSELGRKRLKSNEGYIWCEKN